MTLLYAHGPPASTVKISTSIWRRIDVEIVLWALCFFSWFHRTWAQKTNCRKGQGGFARLPICRSSAQKESANGIITHYMNSVQGIASRPLVWQFPFLCPCPVQWNLVEKNRLRSDWVFTYTWLSLVWLKLNNELSSLMFSLQKHSIKCLWSLIRLHDVVFDNTSCFDFSFFIDLGQI